MQEETQFMTLPPIQPSHFLSHFAALMGPYGLYQHATIRTPLLSEGYCTDDNARAIQMLARLFPLVSQPEQKAVHDFFMRCWKFLREAEEKPGYFYNFRSSEGAWLPEDRSQDMLARVIRALTTVLASPHFSHVHEEARRMLSPLLDRVNTMEAPRFFAEYSIATADMNDVPGYEKAVEVLTGLWNAHASEGWPWFEDSMTYANALFPHSMLYLVRKKYDSNIEKILHTSAKFLLKSTIRNSVFIPIGSNGWYPKGGVPSQDNQQAIEAGTMIDFLIDYQAAYPDKVKKEDIAAVYGWFFGENTNGIQMADVKTGACLDGIFISGPNPNNGAESMLAYQWAEIRMREATIVPTAS